jgi:O-antigen/teichoic acid export membrane protein
VATLRTNILSNYAGQIWMAAMGVLFLPQYIHILGMEAFGFVGLMLSFQAILQLFDFGIGSATNRELSRRVHDPALADGTRDLVRTSEIIIWLLMVAAALLIWIFSGLMVDHWLHLQSIGRGDANRDVTIMGIAIALYWPSLFYANCLSGLERQPTLNLINVLFTTLRYAGVLPVLLWLSPSIKAFLWWYAAVGAGQSVATAVAVWRTLPKGTRFARWRIEELHGSRHFAGGLFSVSILALGVSQVDRLILASLRPLEDLGQYTLALSVASGLGRMVQPMFNALYPRFSRLVARHDVTTLRELYHLSSQYLAVVIASVATILIVFAHGVLLLWTGDAILANKVAPPLSMLVAGYALNGLMNIPYAMQLAHGWTRLAVGLNAASLFLGIPLCVWAVQRYGITGATLPWLFANLASVVIGIPLMHRRLLRSEMAAWYLRDNLPPILVAMVVALAFDGLLPPIPRTITGVALLGVVSATTLTMSSLASPSIRKTVRMRLARHISA